MKVRPLFYKAPGYFFACVLFVLCALLNACAAQPQAGSQASPMPAALTSVSLQLAWMPTAEYAPFYVAEQHGFYKEEKIALSFLPRGDQPATDSVAEGKAQFGIASADRVLLARDEGKPLVAIATLYQRCPIVYISLAERNIVKPADLIGKKVEVDVNGTTGIVYQAFLKSQGISPDQINMVVQPDVENDAKRLVNGEVDVIDGFFNAQPLQVEKLGKKPRIILVADYGIDIYPNTIFTTEAMIKEQPELVTQFLRATFKGLQKGIENPLAAAEAVIATDSTQNLEIEKQTMQLALPMFLPPGSKPGMMTAESWQLTYETLQDQKMLKHAGDVQSAYDLSFLKAIHAP